jgi:nucleotide-binding universal stress UspA family protein
MLLERIVVGVDFNPASVAAARWTARYLAPEAELVLIYCAPPAKPSAAGTAESIVRARRKLEGLREELGFDRVRTELVEGIPSDRIAELAARVDADLIVVGPHNRYPQIADDVGSTAERLVQRSCAPVLLSTGELRGPPRRLLLPVQGPEISPFVFEWARALEARCGARVSLVHLDVSLCDAASDNVVADVTSPWRALADDFRPYDRFGPSSPPAIRRLLHEVQRQELTAALIAR